MTPEQVAAERERFEAQWKTRTAQPRGPIDAWFWRAEIAHAREAELVAEMDKLRALLEALTSNPEVDLGDLVYEIREREGKGWDGPAVSQWSNTVQEVKTTLAEWRARQGGVG